MRNTHDSPVAGVQAINAGNGARLYPGCGPKEVAARVLADNPGVEYSDLIDLIDAEFLGVGVSYGDIEFVRGQIEEHVRTEGVLPAEPIKVAIKDLKVRRVRTGIGTMEARTVAATYRRVAARFPVLSVKLVIKHASRAAILIEADEAMEAVFEARAELARLWQERTK